MRDPGVCSRVGIRKPLKGRLCLVPNELSTSSASLQFQFWSLEMLLVQEHVQELREGQLLAFKKKKGVSAVQFLNDKNEPFFHITTFSACPTLVPLSGFICL